MSEKENRNNPRKLFKEQDDHVIPNRKLPVEADDVLSVRRSEITSIVPDEKDWNKIYVGRQHGLYSVKPQAKSIRRETL